MHRKSLRRGFFVALFFASFSLYLNKFQTRSASLRLVEIYFLLVIFFFAHLLLFLRRPAKTKGDIMKSLPFLYKKLIKFFSALSHAIILCLRCETNMRTRIISGP